MNKSATPSRTLARTVAAWLAPLLVPVLASLMQQVLQHQQGDLPQARDALLDGVLVDERAPADDDALPLGCAWFDSSQDLREGLSVQEHGADAALPAQMPLHTWLEWELLGFSPGALA
jgi:hypothetical protein